MDTEPKSEPKPVPEPTSPESAVAPGDAVRPESVIAPQAGTEKPAPELSSDPPKDLPQPQPGVPAESPQDPTSNGGTVVTPLPASPEPESNTSKPVLVIVISMVFFALLCAAAYIAYSKSN
jgi:hypothetical protein